MLSRLQALARIHGLGVLHGDMRRDNVLLDVDPGSTREEWQVWSLRVSPQGCRLLACTAVKEWMPGPRQSVSQPVLRTAHTGAQQALVLLPGLGLSSERYMPIVRLHCWHTCCCMCRCTP